MLNDGLLIIAAFVGLAILIGAALLIIVHLEAKRITDGDHHG